MFPNCCKLFFRPDVWWKQLMIFQLGFAQKKKNNSSLNWQRKKGKSHSKKNKEKSCENKLSILLFLIFFSLPKCRSSIISLFLAENYYLLLEHRHVVFHSLLHPIFFFWSASPSHICVWDICVDSHTNVYVEGSWSIITSHLQGFPNSNGPTQFVGFRNSAVLDCPFSTTHTTTWTSE